MKRIVRFLLLGFAILAAADGSAAARNVILLLVNGATQSQFDLARMAGVTQAGLSNTAAMPVSGTLVPLAGSFRDPVLATFNQIAVGRASDRSVGTLSNGEELDSIATLAKLGGRRVGLITDGLLTDFSPGVYYAHEPQAGAREKLGGWLPLCDFNVLAGEVVPPAEERGAGDALGEVMAKIGYRNALNVKNLTPPISRLFVRHTDSVGRRYAAEQSASADRERLLDYTSVALGCLENPNGFFLIVDFAKLAGAARENDTSMVLSELWLYDRVLGEALRFYKAHPDDTLIVAVSLYDAGELQLTREIGADFPRGGSRTELLAELNRQPRGFDQALKLLKAGELFAPDAPDLKLLHRFFFEAPKLTDPATVAALRNWYNFEPSAELRDYRDWIDRVQTLRDRHNGVDWLSKRAVPALTPVLAIGIGAKEFSGEYSPEELGVKLRAALGLPEVAR